MNFTKTKNSEIFSPPKHPQLNNLHQAFTNLQTHCSGFLHHLQSSFSALQSEAKHGLKLGIPSLNFNPNPSSAKNPVWARIVEPEKTHFERARQSAAAMSNEAIEERLAGVPVYALSNTAEEFVLVSGVSTGKSLGLFCFKKEDAEALLHQMKSMDPTMRGGSRVVAVALNKVFQLKVDGVAFRLIPEPMQIQNALTERQKAGFPNDDGFSGVPVFQARSLILKSGKKSYRPIFFRKEDLENSLLRASRQQNQLNPAIRPGEIQVAVFEDVIKGMKEGSSLSDDIVFIPPGFDVSTDNTQRS